MEWEQNKFHKQFQLNGTLFSSVEEILSEAKELSGAIYQFLKCWFDVNESIIVKTSGSTGTPKSISLKKEFVINSAKATGNYFNLQEHTTALLCLPIDYIAGKLMLVRALTLGWKLDIIVSSSNPLEKVEKQYDFSAMVPLQLENSLAKIHLIKKLIVGGGVVSNALQEKLQTVSTVVFATYGMTETITHIAAKKLNHVASLQGEMTKQSFYQTLPNITIYKDDRNCLVIDAPKVTENILFTNDVVQLISDRQFEWLGRFDNVINSGGIKLHPEKIEEKFTEIIVNRFFVAGMPDEKLGEKLVLIVEGNAQEINYESIELSKFEVPKEIYFVKNFAATDSGKIQRKKTLKKIFTK
jgi:O-succinylbenzoic acid--CoA ligase